MTPFARIRGNRQATPRNPEIIRVENHQGRSGIDYAPARLNQFDQDTILRSSRAGPTILEQVSPHTPYHENRRHE
jgi:hypothetical protein